MKLSVSFIVAAVLIFGVINQAFAELDMVVKGLFKNGAIIVVNGKQRLVKKGKSTPEGILLVDANSQFALVEIDGKQKKLYLSKQIASEFSQAEKKEVRINSGANGHYYARGYINGKSVEFVVDTGASTIALNSNVANYLGVRYELGRRLSVETASGVVPGYKVNLNSVAIGDIKVENVEAIVTEGGFPSDILLGNTFLSRIDYAVESGVLILQTKY